MILLWIAIPVAVTVMIAVWRFDSANDEFIEVNRRERAMKALNKMHNDD